MAGRSRSVPAVVASSVAHLAPVAMLVLMLGFARPAPAQQASRTAPQQARLELPVDPSAGFAPAAAKAASLTGSVADTGGALIPGAFLSLRAVSKEQPPRSTEADSEGRFRFTGLRPGSYILTVAAPGFEPYTSTTITLEVGETDDLPAIALGIPAGHADVTVSVSRAEIAGEEIHAAEQQRVLGVFPNFYTSFQWDAVPLDSRQKFDLALHATLDPTAFLTASLVASAEQIRGTFPEYGGGAEGFGKRYGAAYADGFVGKIIGSALLPSVFRQDPRYFYMGPERGTVRQRALHAVLSAVLARGDNGREEPNYSHILGNAAAGAISTTYHPASDSAGKLALDNALLGTVGEAGVYLVREFLLKPFTHGGAASNPSAAP